MKLSCHKCNHEWDYKGAKTEYCGCPNQKCRYRVNISKCRVEEEE